MSWCHHGVWLVYVNLLKHHIEVICAQGNGITQSNCARHLYIQHPAPFPFCTCLWVKQPSLFFLGRSDRSLGTICILFNLAVEKVICFVYGLAAVSGNSEQMNKFKIRWCCCFKSWFNLTMIINTLRPGPIVCRFPDNIFKANFFYGNYGIFIQISLKYVPEARDLKDIIITFSIFRLFQIYLLQEVVVSILHHYIT